jgi:hypothetical protein
MSCTYHLRYTNAQKVKVSDAGELEEELFRYKVPYCITGCSDAVGNVGETTAVVYQGRFVFELERYMAPIRWRDNVFATQNKLDNGLLI